MKIYKVIANVFFGLIALTVFLIMLGYIFMELLLFPAPYSGRKTGNKTLISNGEQLDVFYQKKSSTKVILYSHGNNEYLAKIQPWLNKMVARGYSVLAYDYAGYGASSGKASVRQSIIDIETAYHFLTRKEHFSPQSIIVVGYSVGSGPATYLATKFKVKKLILIAPFASAAQVVLPWQMPFDKFKNAELLSQKKVPLTIFHGDKDMLIPYRNSKKIYKSARHPKKLIKINGADHKNIFQKFENQFWREIDR